MADSATFEWACAALEGNSSLSRLEARGTVRLALKLAGLDARHVSGVQMRVVFERVLPSELESRGIAEGEALCDALKSGLDTRPGDPRESADTPEAVFRRLGTR